MQRTTGTKAKETTAMVDFLLSPATQILLLTFFWVPFALAAYLVEGFDPERARRSVRKLVHPTRHDRPRRPTTAAAATA